MDLPRRASHEAVVICRAAIDRRTCKVRCACCRLCSGRGGGEVGWALGGIGRRVFGRMFRGSFGGRLRGELGGPPGGLMSG